MAVFPVCDVLQGGTSVAGPAGDQLSSSEECFLLQCFCNTCLCACSLPDPLSCYMYHAEHPSAPCILRDHIYSHCICCFLFVELLATLLRAALESVSRRLSCHISHLPGRFLHSKSPHAPLAEAATKAPIF